MAKAIDLSWETTMATWPCRLVVAGDQRATQPVFGKPLPAATEDCQGRAAVFYRLREKADAGSSRRW